MRISCRGTWGTMSEDSAKKPLRSVSGKVVLDNFFSLCMLSLAFYSDFILDSSRISDSIFQRFRARFPLRMTSILHHCSSSPWLDVMIVVLMLVCTSMMIVVLLCSSYYSGRSDSYKFMVHCNVTLAILFLEIKLPLSG